jgi:hypothetical protein
VVVDEFKQREGVVRTALVAPEADEQPVDGAAGFDQAAVRGQILATPGEKRRVGGQVGGEDHPLGL